MSSIAPFALMALLLLTTNIGRLICRLVVDIRLWDVEITKMAGEG